MTDNRMDEMRLALDICRMRMCAMCRKANGVGADCIYGCDVAKRASEALGLPPRNCDVGTPKEQSARYENFCFAHRSRERCCLDCPLLHEPSCELAWAQMTYVEETAPDRDIPLDIDRILAVGRELQASDTWHGATYDTVKLLCDTIEALRGRGEGGFTPRKRVSKIGPADFTADRDASSGTGGGT